MRRSVVIALTTMGVTTGLLMSNADSANTDLSRFEAKVAKSASADIDVTPPVVCVCKETGRYNEAGYLRQYREPAGPGGQVKILIHCRIFNFESTGEFSGEEVCGQWEVLPK